MALQPSALQRMLRPHYIFCPTQVVRRCRCAVRPPSREQSARLPWGSPITYDPREAIGMVLARCGVFDLTVCEVLLRLADGDETCLDVGANIGQMTSVLAYAAGPLGRVLAFEPHPLVTARLQRHVSRWNAMSAMAAIDVHPVALSDRTGVATLASHSFDHNQGSATLESRASIRPLLDTHTVAVRQLDSVVGANVRVGVMKLDIEGHELRALEGARGMLEAGCIRDIVFEERDPPPTPVTHFLRSHGYAIFRLNETLLRPAASAVTSHDRSLTCRRDDPSFLATRAPARAIERLAVRGWAVYSSGPARRFAPRQGAPAIP